MFIVILAQSLSWSVLYRPISSGHSIIYIFFVYTLPANNLLAVFFMHSPATCALSVVQAPHIKVYRPIYSVIACHYRLSIIFQTLDCYMAKAVAVSACSKMSFIVCLFSIVKCRSHLFTTYLLYNLSLSALYKILCCVLR